ncbi:Y-family DNA polymerase [Acinetobacter vivianii]|uniref:Y-family DNA polymerase n=1 Tax=Acinetobacter vivianii TaxID=1776742 RepID=A0AAJ6P496_9GAMM|nr:Y-family DNA polymerase [Acinetobacter vivianii]WDZ50155.1 Y-family DNA polymerase [Acinetobacter vivianii]
MKSNTRIFALVDVNNCYVSCERVFNPSLNDRPVIVLSNNDGCAVARSQESKDIGIKMGVPVFQIEDVIKKYDVQVLSSNYALYAEMSRRFMSLLGQYVAPGEQEIYSIDECFLDLTTYAKNYDLTAYAQEMRMKAQQWLGLPCCIGIGRSKTEAKIANHIAKKNKYFDGVCNLAEMDPCSAEQLLSQVDVAEVWGVGRQNCKKLNLMNIKSVLDLIEANPKEIKKSFSIVMEKTVRELQGVSCIDIEIDTPSKKQIISSRSYGHPVYEKNDIKSSVRLFVTRGVERMRNDESLCKLVGVFIQTVKFNKDEKYAPYIIVQMHEYTDDLLEITRAAMKGIDQIYKPGFKYKKAGIVLLELIHKSKFVPDLFTDYTHRFEREKLSQTMEAIKAKYGKDHVSLGLCNDTHAIWQMNQNRRSPSYLTNWNELFRIG